MKLDEVLNEFRRRRSTDIGSSYSNILGNIRRKMSSGTNKFKAITKALKKSSAINKLPGSKLKSLKKKIRKDLGVSEDGLTNQFNQQVEERISILENLPFDKCVKELYKWIKTDEINFEMFHELMSFVADAFNEDDDNSEPVSSIEPEVLNDNNLEEE